MKILQPQKGLLPSRLVMGKVKVRQINMRKVIVSWITIGKLIQRRATVSPIVGIKIYGCRQNMRAKSKAIPPGKGTRPTRGRRKISVQRGPRRALPRTRLRLSILISILRTQPITTTLGSSAWLRIYMTRAITIKSARLHQTMISENKIIISTIRKTAIKRGHGCFLKRTTEVFGRTVNSRRCGRACLIKMRGLMSRAIVLTLNIQSKKVVTLKTKRMLGLE